MTYPNYVVEQNQDGWYGAPTAVDDVRVGGMTRRRLFRWREFLMRVPDEVLESVVFLGSRMQNGEIFAGTAFFVTKHLGVMDFQRLYLVTAKHNIEAIRRDSIDGSVLMRMNTRDGQFYVAEVSTESWIVDEDNPNLDVAVLEWGPDPGWGVTFRYIPETMFADNEEIKANAIGPGDDVFLTGLFHRHLGSRRNVPIVRVGTIAAIPDEPIELRQFDPSISAYRTYAANLILVESRSIGGLSGSPVFVLTSGVRGSNVNLQLSFSLLGLIQGHWDLPVLGMNQAPTSVNEGIGLVVPAQDILLALNHRSLVDARAHEIERLQREHGFVNDAMEPDLERGSLTQGELRSMEETDQ